MRNINFISTATPEQQLALKRWYHISIIIFIITIISLGSISAWQFYRLKKSSKERKIQEQTIAPLLPTLERKKNAEITWKELETKTDRIKHLQTRIKQLSSLLQSLSTICCQNVYLSTVHTTEKTLDITLWATNIQTARKAINDLQQKSGICGLNITAFEPNKNQQQKGLFITIKQSQNKRLQT